jgi:hypothetical protein
MIGSHFEIIAFEHDLVRKVCNFSGSCPSAVTGSVARVPLGTPGRRSPVTTPIRSGRSTTTSSFLRL